MEHTESYEEGISRVLLGAVRQLGGSEAMLQGAAAEIQKLLRGESPSPSQLEPEQYYELEGLLGKLRGPLSFKRPKATEPFEAAEILRMSWETVQFLEDIIALLRMAPKGKELQQICQEGAQQDTALHYLELVAGKAFTKPAELAKATGLPKGLAEKILQGGRKARLLRGMVASLNNGATYQEIQKQAEQLEGLQQQDREQLIRRAIADTYSWRELPIAARDPGIRAIADDLGAPFSVVLESYLQRITGVSDGISRD